MERGVSLIELALGVVVGGIIAISAARFISSSKQAQVNATLRAQTEQRMREFLETTKKQIAQSRNSYPGASTILNNPYQNRNCSFVVNGNPSLANCGDAALRFSILNMDRYLDANNIATYFTQNITTECVAPSPGVPIQPFEVTAIQECSPCVGGQVPVIRSRFSNRPGLVLRFSGGAEAPEIGRAHV